MNFSNIRLKCRELPADQMRTIDTKNGRLSNDSDLDCVPFSEHLPKQTYHDLTILTSARDFRLNLIENTRKRWRTAKTLRDDLCWKTAYRQ